MPKAKNFRKQPAIVEAYQWMGDQEGVFEWAKSISWGNGSNLAFERRNGKSRVYIENTKGEQTDVPVGHYVMCSIEGHFFVVSPETFKTTYEVV